jgi:hypothetical protein
MKIETKYGLRNKNNKNLITVSTHSNSGGDCVSVLHELQDNIYYSVWMVDKGVHAEWVRNNPAQWYDADYDTPYHRFEPNDLEVVKLTISTEIEPIKVTIPKILSRSIKLALTD